MVPSPESYPRIAAYGLALLVAVILVYTASTSSVAFGPYNANWDGSSALRTVAGEQGVSVETTQSVAAYTTSDPTRTVAFVLAPTTNYTSAEVTRLRRFVRHGGTLVVASEATAAATGNTLLADLGSTARFENATLRDDRFNYRSPAMPVAGGVENHTLTRGVDAITLNYGTALSPGNGTVLANTSAYAYLDRDESGSITDSETLRRYPVVVNESLGNGSVVAVSDASVFINAMLDRSSNDRFARNLLADRERAILDHSHSASVPPLRTALGVVRRSPLAQVLVGICGILVVGGWRHRVGRRFLASVRRSGTPVEEQTVVDADDVAASLGRDHPEWDDERIRRIAESAVRDRRD